MTTTMLKVGLLGVGVLCLSACTGPAPQQTAPPATVEPAAPTTAKLNVSINEVMVSLIDHAGHNLWDVEQEGRNPKNDAEWQVVQEHAVQIAAAGPAITVGGAGSRDAEWVKTPSWHMPSTADCGGLMIGVDSIEPNTPPLEIEKVPPVSSSMPSLPSCARLP